MQAKIIGELNKLREKIDKIDEKIAILLDQRAKQIQILGKIKKANNLKTIDKKREASILSRFKSGYKKKIFKKIIEESRKLQEGPRS